MRHMLVLFTATVSPQRLQVAPFRATGLGRDAVRQCCGLPTGERECTSHAARRVSGSGRGWRRDRKSVV